MAKQIMSPVFMAAIADLLGVSRAELNDVRRVLIDINSGHLTQVYVHRYASDPDKLGHLIGTMLETPGAVSVHNVPAPDRQHLVDVPARSMDALREWLARPNGSFMAGRVSFDAVEGGGILIRTRPYGT